MTEEGEVCLVPNLFGCTGEIIIP